jgi:XTP/dITP diphosphohydrolase
MKLIIATRNRHKVREIRAIWSDLNLTIHSLLEIPQQITTQETGSTFSENAVQKALQVAAHVDGFVMADDSGIEVDALGGEPGVFSARYAGPQATDIRNNRKLLSALEDIPWEKRGARYRCVIALVDLQKGIHLSEGTCEGIIAFEPSGREGFGYDPLFYLPEYEATMAQLPPKIKNQISHRAKALQKTREMLDILLSKQ